MRHNQQMPAFKILSLLTACLHIFTALFPLVGHSQPRIPLMVVEPVEAREISDRIEALGTLRANEQVVLASSVTDTVASIGFEDGQFVEKGTVLVELTDNEEKALVDEASSLVQETRRQYERVKSLKESGAAPISIVDQRYREYQTASAQFEAAKSRLADRVITAPFSGVLGLRNVSIGALLQPGDKIVTLDDLSRMKLDLTIPSIFLEAVKIGGKIEGTAKAYPSKVFQGMIESIDSRINPVTRSIIVRATIPNESMLLKPGLLMQVALFANIRNGISIPEGALLMVAESKYVFVAKESTTTGEAVLERRMVTGGRRSGGMLEITKGLADGELLVTDGIVKASDGMKVQIARKG